MGNASIDPAITCDDCGARDILYFGHWDGCPQIEVERQAEFDRLHDLYGHGVECFRKGCPQETWE